MSRDEPLTPRQAEYLEFVRAFVRDQGYAPSYRQIAGRFGCHVNNAREVVLQLVHKGRLGATPRVSRSLRLVGVRDGAGWDWVRFADRRPPAGRYLIAARTGQPSHVTTLLPQPMVAYYDPAEAAWRGFEWDNFRGVTAWMPLPARPGEGDS